MLSDATIAQITQRGVKEIISLGEFTELLKSGRSLRLKMGFDPSRPDIHLGHVVGLRKLRQLQELGHQVILIVGDWTAQYVAMRALKYPDAFPASDLGLLKAIGVSGNAGTKELRRRAESWRPWRSYAAMLLWSSLSNSGG